MIAKQAIGEAIDEEVLEDMQAGLQTIECRYAALRKELPPADAPAELRPVKKVRELLLNVRRLLQPTMQTQHISLKLYLPDENMTDSMADAEQMEQMLINLIKNGMEACEAVSKPCVEVVAYIPEQEKNRVRINETDNGDGIPADVLDKIFIPFYTTKKQGSGIGLSLSKQIIRQHGGSIRVNSQPGGPTVFSLQLKAIKE